MMIQLGPASHFPVVIASRHACICATTCDAGLGNTPPVFSKAGRGGRVSCAPLLFEVED